MDNSYTSFRAVEHYGKPHLTNLLLNNLESFLGHAFLKIGTFTNVTTGSPSGIFGGDFSTLHKVKDPSYQDNTVYQSPRKQWCFQNSGISYVSPTGGSFNPLTPQVYFNGSGISTGTTNHQFYIDYTNGKVVFSTPQIGTVQASYSYNSVQIYQADYSNFSLEVQYNTELPNNFQWSQNITSGDYSISTNDRAQLPAIFLEPTTSKNSKPFEIGGLTSYNYIDILLHLITEDKYTLSNLCDLFYLQKEKTIILYDLAKIVTNNYLPLDEKGAKNPNGRLYPDIVNDSSLVFRHAVFKEINITKIETKTPNLFWSVARLTVEIIL